jgi:hypothetical protein
LIIKAIGVSNAKNIIAKTIGLTILPRKRPNLYHSLLKRDNRSGDIIEINAKITAMRKKITPNNLIAPFQIKYSPISKNIIEKNQPNFLLEGRFFELKVIILYIKK